MDTAITFIKNYALAHAILLPGRIPGYKSTSIQLLPSSSTKSSIWLQYCNEAEAQGIRAASRSHFTTLWKQLVPHITICRPMSDLCWVCQQNSNAIIRAANKPEAEKSEVIIILSSNKQTLAYYRY